MDIDTLFHRLGIRPQQLSELCQNSGIAELAVFGSIGRNDFHADSDIDLLVTFATECQIDLLGFVRLERQFGELLGRSVDLVSKSSVESDRNWLRRQEILENSQVIYESRSAVST